MKLDREYQRELLTKLADAYPRRCKHEYVLPSPTEDDKVRYAQNMTYLEAHGLVSSGVQYDLSNKILIHDPSITTAGMDFLADDGGLTAILKTVTVKLHDETLRAMIGQKIAEAPLAPADKKKWTDRLASLPADAIKHLTMKLLDTGLNHAPDALQLIESALSKV